jgi:alanine-synthesizing transaminase
MYRIANDEQLVLELVRQEKILLVHGTAFNWPNPDHLRVVFLPRVDDLAVAIERFGDFLSRYRQ